MGHNQRRAIAIIGAMLFTSVMPSRGTAQVARIEVHPIQSMTLTDQQFLTGEKGGTPVVIGGELRIPTPGAERLPVVVMLHGSGGIARREDEWSQVINASGIATFIVDSFTARGIVNVQANQAQLGRWVQTFDAYRVIELLSKHARIDPARIVLMGFSRGGQAALYASLKRFQQMHGPAGVTIAGYVPFYPTCNTVFLKDEDVSDKPIRIFHGSADDYVPVEPCRRYVERLRKAEKDVQLTEYADAHHVFDSPAFRTPIKASQAQTVRNCRMQETLEGTVINLQTQKPFTYEDSCVERGPTIAYDEAAHKASLVAVRDLLRTTFKLN